MARPWSNFSRVLRLVAVGLLLVPLLTSCFDLAVNVDFRTATTGQIRIDALAYRLAQGLQIVDGPDRIVFPTTRAGWQAVVDQVPGATLVSWAGTEEDLGFRTKATLAFSTSRALEGLFVVFKQKLTLLQDTQGKWTVVFVPQVPRVTAADPATRKLWTALWGSVVWTFGFTPPGQPRTERSVTLADLAGPQPPAEWTFSW